jgi:hypothetical protein
MRALWRRGGLATLGCVLLLVPMSTSADRAGSPPPNHRSCPTQDHDVVVRGGRAYRWADDDVRLLSYQFKAGTFPPNMLTFEPTYPQLLFDADQGSGCLTVRIPRCGQVDTTTVEFEPPAMLSHGAAVAAITGGHVLPGAAVLGSTDRCACPEPPPGQSRAVPQVAFGALGGGPPDPQPCHGRDHQARPAGSPSP